MTKVPSMQDTVRELTAVELDHVAGGFSLGGYSLEISFSNNNIAVGIGGIDLSIFGTQHPVNVGIGEVSFASIPNQRIMA